MSSSPHLPADVQTLQEWVRARDLIIEQLKSEIFRLRRWQYGQSSEQLAAIDQLQLALDDLGPAPKLAPAPSATVPAAATAESNKQAKVVPLRRAPRVMPAHLPRRTIVHATGHCDCPACGGVLRQMGEDVSEQLHFVPGYFEVIRHVRPKLSCRACSTIVQALAPLRPIARGMATAGLLAQVLIAKYADHCPLYRQSQIYHRSGVELDRATLAAWVAESAKLLAPLAAAIGRYVMRAEKVHADDTPVPVLEPGRGKTRTARVWTYVRDDRPSGGSDPPAVWYQYSPDRKSERPQRHLKNFSGILQADAYSGFAPLYQKGRIVEAACWAHARRKFFDLFKRHHSPVTEEAIRRIAECYAIEKQIRGEPPEERLRVRVAETLPRLEALREWLTATLRQTSGKSALGKAIKYTLVRWDAMTLFTRDGRAEIDNNTAEREIRSVVMGRRNYLFQGSDHGGDNAAIIYSLINTAKLNGVEPYAYMKAVLERIADHPINHIDELLPWQLNLNPAESQSLAA